MERTFMQKWDYLTTTLTRNEYWINSDYANKKGFQPSGNSRIDLLKEVGDDGWELVAAYENFFYFKRPKE